MAVLPFTADADLAFDPRRLADDPRLEGLLAGAGFVRSPNMRRVGTWVGADGVEVDLMVPTAVGGAGCRGADLGVHGNRVARTAQGLEAALADDFLTSIEALDSNDRRRFEVRVAGPCALLIAKLHKIAERQGRTRRADDKDALDVYRLLVGIPTETYVEGLTHLLGEELSARVTEEGLGYLEQLFGSPDGAGSQMAARVVEELEESATIAAACAALAEDALSGLGRGQGAWL